MMTDRTILARPPRQSIREAIGEAMGGETRTFVYAREGGE